MAPNQHVKRCPNIYCSYPTSKSWDLHVANMLTKLSTSVKTSAIEKLVTY